MTKYITLIIAAALTLGVSSVQADKQSRTNKVSAEAKKKAAEAKKPTPTEARKKYAAAVKKIREAVKAGKLTEKQAKEKYAALRKKMAPNREGMLKRFDKNKDGKLDEKERAAARKAMEARTKKRGESRRGKSKGRKSRRK